MTCSCLKSTTKSMSKETFEPYDFTSDMQQYWKDEHLQKNNKKKVTFVTPYDSNAKPEGRRRIEKIGASSLRELFKVGDSLPAVVSPTDVVNLEADPVYGSMPLVTNVIEWDIPALREAVKKPENIKNIPGIERFQEVDWINLWWILEWFKNNNSESEPNAAAPGRQNTPTAQFTGDTIDTNLSPVDVSQPIAQVKPDESLIHELKEYNIQTLFKLNDPELTRYLYIFLYWEQMYNKASNSMSKPSVTIRLGKWLPSPDPGVAETQEQKTYRWYIGWWHEAVIKRVNNL